ncbi:hypothetical protein V6N13_106867 [Hibiscus sabdariffa]
MEDNSSDHDGDFVFNGDDLTWSQVSRAVGAHDPSYLTRSSKNLSSTSKGKGVATSSATFAPSSTHQVSVYDDEIEEDIGEDGDGFDGDEYLMMMLIWSNAD